MAALLDSLRTLIRDTSNTGTYRFSDIELEDILGMSIDTFNVWCKTIYTLADYDDINTVVPIYQRQLVLLQAKILITEADIADAKRYVKFVTQDVQMDPSEVSARLNRMLFLLQKDLEWKIRKWVGIDIGAWAGTLGEVDLTG